jgi:hypothetical protein
VSGGFRLLTSDAPAEDAVLVSSGPLLAGSWLGDGDVAGLRSLAVTLYSRVPVITDRSQAGGDRPVSQLTDPAESLAGVICRAAGIIDDLAAGLTRIENDLEDQAHTASRYGVRIGTDRRPPPAVAVPSAQAGAVSEQHWTLTYQRAYAQAAADAQRARQQAARRLADLHATLAPPRPSPGPRAAGSLTIGQFLTGLSSYLAGWTGAPGEDAGSRCAARPRRPGSSPSRQPAPGRDAR